MADEETRGNRLWKIVLDRERPITEGMTLAAAALTTDGSESLAMDTTGITIPSQGIAIAQPGTEAVMASGTS